MLVYHSRCEHCGESLRSRRVGARFCSHACARDRMNVKMVRGAKVHDLLVEWQGSYKKRYLLTEIGRLVAGWIEADKRRSNGDDRARTQDAKGEEAANVGVPDGALHQDRRG